MNKIWRKKNENRLSKTHICNPLTRALAATDHSNGVGTWGAVAPSEKMGDKNVNMVYYQHGVCPHTPTSKASSYATLKTVYTNPFSLLSLHAETENSVILLSLSTHTELSHCARARS